MKRVFYFLLMIMLGVVAFSSCKGGKGGASDEDSTKIQIVGVDSIATPKLTDKVCTIGDGSTMNVLELITEEGDTFNLECSDGMVVGGVNVGDKVDVTFVSSAMDSKAIACINMTALQHVWSQRGADGHKQSLEMDELGVATTYDMSIDYDHWSLSGGKLVLYSPKEVGSEKPAPSDTFDIMQLDDDNLVLMHGNLESAFYRDN